ncbi:DUF4435 domain-containing protein [Photobacterium sp. GB-1]|uniref:DUF4435 domain-containing protein n=1 Tax=Photobacterium sp. GB-1 TaxID=2022111 RepID=UPI001E28E270|nr:DUF4435 domain-containing protein [Photobacterium sp. GB-1]
MSRVEAMRKARDFEVVKIQNILKEHSSDPDVLICIFEGEDAKYYGSRIDSVFRGRNRKNIKCKGRNNLLKLKSKVESNKYLSKIKILYFADRDFDFNYTTHGNIYFTPCYSIENLYVGSDVLDRILCDEVGICSIEEKEIYDLLHANFEIYLKQADSELLTLHSWLMCQVKMSETNTSIELNLKNTKVEEFINITCQKIESKYDIQSLYDKFSLSHMIEEKELEYSSDLLLKNAGHLSYRGKYMLEFFGSIVNKMLQECNVKGGQGHFGVTRKCQLSISQDSVLSTLSQYARTPSCLTDFLKHHAK